MSKANHTPGPWSIRVRDGRSVLVTLHRDIDCTYADSVGWKLDGDDAENAARIANAHLICAAPDLLAALKRSIELFGDYCEPNDMEAYAWIYAARDAIARAEGT